MLKVALCPLKVENNGIINLLVREIMRNFTPKFKTDEIC